MNYTINCVAFYYGRSVIGALSSSRRETPAKLFPNTDLAAERPPGQF
jgi:hypothetical protein